MKTVNQWMRNLHRDLGFFTIGLIIIYSLSGIALIYRDSDIFKTKQHIEAVLPTNMEATDLGSALKIKNMDVLSEDNESIYFRNGTYNKQTGEVSYNKKALVFPLNKFASLHTLSSKHPIHWFGIALGVILLFLAISSFWMYKPNTKMFKRGMILVASGLVLSLGLLFIVC
ncbi:MAG: hypothetical protein RRZ64_04185 [Rikenellaceae bacterium]